MKARPISFRGVKVGPSRKPQAHRFQSMALVIGTTVLVKGSASSVSSIFVGEGCLDTR